MGKPGFAENFIKEPNVSGQFYPADPQTLARTISQDLHKADVAVSSAPIGILIVPHAGYMYSGPVAAYGFKALHGRSYKTVVILGPSHYYAFDGTSVWEKGGFRTPLGIADVDEDFARRLIAQAPGIAFVPQVFEKEHSVEVEIPFLQESLKGFKVVPVITGQLSLEQCRRLADALDKVIGKRTDVLVVVSSDMSHYHPDAVARTMDHRAIQDILKLDAPDLWQQCLLREKMEMCGFVPVTTALFLAGQRGLTQVTDLDYRDSGDVSGDMRSVVGYTAVIFQKPGRAAADSSPAAVHEASVPDAQGLTIADKRLLLEIAVQSIRAHVLGQKQPSFSDMPPRLKEKQGAFVTIHEGGRLRGCIGHIVSDEPLYQTVRDMAIAAAVHDPRFAPLSPAELGRITLEISVLSVPRRISDVHQIKLGVDGVIVSRGMMHQGVFLPQVATETGWDLPTFLSQLCSQKAGLPADAWKDPGTRIDVFTADVFSAKDLPQR